MSLVIFTSALPLAQAVSDSNSVIPRPPPKAGSATTISANGGKGGGKGVCGTPQILKDCPKGRIVNGTQSCYGQFPWQVRI